MAAVGLSGVDNAVARVRKPLSDDEQDTLRVTISRLYTTLIGGVPEELDAPSRRAYMKKQLTRLPQAVTDLTEMKHMAVRDQAAYCRVCNGCQAGLSPDVKKEIAYIVGDDFRDELMGLSVKPVVQEVVATTSALAAAAESAVLEPAVPVAEIPLVPPADAETTRSTSPVHDGEAVDTRSNSPEPILAPVAASSAGLPLSVEERLVLPETTPVVVDALDPVVTGSISSDSSELTTAAAAARVEDRDVEADPWAEINASADVPAPPAAFGFVPLLEAAERRIYRLHPREQEEVVAAIEAYGAYKASLLPWVRPNFTNTGNGIFNLLGTEEDRRLFMDIAKKRKDSRTSRMMDQSFSIRRVHTHPQYLDQRVNFTKKKDSEKEHPLPKEEIVTTVDLLTKALGDGFLQLPEVKTRIQQAQLKASQSSNARGIQRIHLQRGITALGKKVLALDPAKQQVICAAAKATEEAGGVCSDVREFLADPEVSMQLTSLQAIRTEHAGILTEFTSNRTRSKEQSDADKALEVGLQLADWFRPAPASF